MSQPMSIDPNLQPVSSQAYRDWLGVAASVLCAIHCAAMPFVVGFLPLLGLSFLAEPSFHKWMVGICLGLALLAFVPGWRRHQRLAPAIIGLCGLGLITFAAFAGPEDCCPTPCAANGTPDEASVMTVALNEEIPCAASCCDSESASGTVPAPADSLVAAGFEEEACAAPCCAAEGEGSILPPDAITVVEIMTVEEDATCIAGCCPEEEGKVLTAGSSDFMSMVWLLMTPIGGVILVAAHLTNHRLGCECKTGGCCLNPTNGQKTA